MGLSLDRFRKIRPSEWVDWLADAPLPSSSQPAAPVQPQVHRPQSYSPVQRPAASFPQQIIVNTPPRPAGLPGMAQPIQASPPVQQPIRTTPMARTAQPAWPVPTARQPQPIQSFAPVSPVRPMAQSPIAQSASPSAAVSIQISMPKFKPPELPYKKIGYWAGGVAVFAGLAVGGWTAYQYFGKKDQVAVKGAATVYTSPTFDTLAPKDKPQLGEGTDPASTAYDGKRNLYTFKDNLMGFPLVVSQQPLPDDIKKDPAKLKKVAESMGGKLSSVETAYGKVYVTTTEDGQAQRSVFAYKEVMVFVQSYKVFDNDTWKFYVESLRQ